MEPELLAHRPRISSVFAAALAIALAGALLFVCPSLALANTARATTSTVALKVKDASTGETTLVKTFSRDRLAYLASFNGDGSEGGYLFNEKVMAVAQYVLLDQLFDDADVSFGQGDEVVVSGAGGTAASYTLSYDDMTEAHYFYPNYQGNRIYDTDGAVEVPGPGIALAWNTAQIDSNTGMPTAAYAFDNAYYTAYDSGNVRFFIGLTDAQFSSGDMKGARLIQWVDSITVVKPHASAPDPDPSGPDAPDPDPSNPGGDVPTPDPDDPQKPGDPDPTPLTSFTDVGLGPGETPHWVVSGGWLRRALDAGIIQGYADEEGNPTGLFGPDDAVTRGQLAVMLYRSAHPDWKTIASDVSAQVNGTPFADNADGAYFTLAINWAYKQGILTGSRDDAGALVVRPNDRVTREEAAAMLYRYAAGSGADAASAGAAAFASAPDAPAVSVWAADAVGWCYSHGVMTGKADSGALCPQASATRAEMCKMTMATIASV